MTEFVKLFSKQLVKPQDDGKYFLKDKSIHLRNHTDMQNNL